VILINLSNQRVITAGVDSGIWQKIIYVGRSGKYQIEILAHVTSWGSCASRGSTIN
jgi:hypothetical protein